MVARLTMTQSLKSTRQRDVQELMDIVLRSLAGGVVDGDGRRPCPAGGEGCGRGAGLRRRELADHQGWQLFPEHLGVLERVQRRDVVELGAGEWS